MVLEPEARFPAPACLPVPNPATDLSGIRVREPLQASPSRLLGFPSSSSGPSFLLPWHKAVFGSVRNSQCSGKARLLPLLLPTRLVAIVRTLGLSGPLFLGLKHEGRVLSTPTPFQPFLVSVHVRLLRCKDHSLLSSTSVVGGQVCTPVHPSRLTSVSAGGIGGAEE